MPFQMGIDLEAEVTREMGRCRIAVPRVCIAEVRAMQGSVKDAAAALKYAERFEVAPSEGLGDDAVVGCARRTGGIVVTGDRGLIRRLREAGLRVLRPRQRKRLELR